MKLIGTDGARYYSLELTPGRQFVVGRSADADLFVPSRTISRKHAFVVQDASDGGVTLTDNNSHNGTFVNGVRITEQVPIALGDRLMFGDTEFKLSDGSAGSDNTRDSAITRPAEFEPEKSVVLSLNDALKSLPAKVTDIPRLFPTLSEMARMLVLDEPRETMLQRSLELVARVIPAERLAVLFVSDNHEELYTGATLLPEGKDPGSFTLSRTIISEILTKKNTVLIGDPSDDPRFASQQSIIMSRMNSAMAVPLFDEGEVLGILYVDTSNPLHRYSDDFLRLLATFGNIIASRISNYQLLNERQEKKVIESELARASAIQKSMLVTEMPNLSEYEVRAFQHQSRSVGGDLYDFCQLPDGRTLFLVADVSGKGTGAALLMSNLLASFRILYAAAEFDPVAVIKQISRQMVAYTPPEMFATLFMGLIDPTTHSVSFVNAGHNPPVLVRQDLSIEHLEPSGIMIGAFDPVDWVLDEIKMNEGDLLVVFTDGVTEAENPVGAQYGEERLEQLLKSVRNDDANDVIKRLVADIEKFAENAPQSDDITAVMIKRG